MRRAGIEGIQSLGNSSVSPSTFTSSSVLPPFSMLTKESTSPLCV